jgi:DNA-directed RNA polymerase subunit E'/Rpb7
MSIVIRKQENPKTATDQQKIYGVYNKSVLDTKVILLVTEIGKNIKTNLESKIVSKIGGKCITEGYIKPGSIRIINYSSGSINGDIIEYHVLFECMICLPVEGMLIECTSKTITKAGIHAQVIDEDGNMPVTVFVARDHHHIDDRFLSVKENTKITVRVIGIRFELNDKCICAIANLADNISETIVKIKKPKNN